MFCAFLTKLALNHYSNLLKESRLDFGTEKIEGHYQKEKIGFFFPFLPLALSVLFMSQPRAPSAQRECQLRVPAGLPGFAWVL